MIKSLRRKFIIVAMLSVFAVLALVIGIINVINYVKVIDNADSIVNILKDGKGDFGFKDGFGGFGMPDRFASPETPYETRYFTVTLNIEGNAVLVNTSRIAAVDAEQAALYALKLYENGRTSGFYGNYRFGTTEAEADGIMYIFVDCTKELSSFFTFMWISLIVGVAGFALVFVLVLFFSGRVMKPVAESYSKQKRFITDASHELKTPLTVISADADVLEMQGGENEWLSDIKNEVKRLASLTEKLVFLAKMDEEGQPLRVFDFSISDEVEETAGPFDAVALSRGLTFEKNIRPNITYRGDEAMIRQAVSLLLDNAMKYADDGGLVRISLQSVGNKTILTVKNTAGELQSGSLDRFFGRFYRGDKSRNSETGGHGIGLSVVKAVVTAHKGRITAECRQGFAIFTVTL